MTGSRARDASSVEPTPTWRWRIEPQRLREAVAMKRSDPTNFDSAVLFYFGIGGRDDGAIMERMRAHPQGRRIVAERIPLPPEILHPDPLAKLREDTLGYQYWAHLQENDIDPLFLSARSQEVAKQYPATPEYKFVYDRYRDSHDLWHVLTGYGTDMAGEAAIVGWTYAQTSSEPPRVATSTASAPHCSWPSTGATS